MAHRHTFDVVPWLMEDVARQLAAVEAMSGPGGIDASDEALGLLEEIRDLLQKRNESCGVTGGRS